MKLRQINKGHKCPYCKNYSLDWYCFRTVGEGMAQLIKGKPMRGDEGGSHLRCRLCLAEFVEEK